MICHQCNLANQDDGRRYCERCGNYLAVLPGNFHNDLMQLSPPQFLEAASEGLPLIHHNVMALWGEANEIAALGQRRAVGILQLFAEEEAAKALLLFDAIRCPQGHPVDFSRLLRGFGDHLAKGIYVQYYGLRLNDLEEARRVVSWERRRVYREGDYGEFIAPNSVLYMREKRLYVSYARHDDNTHAWDPPYPADILFGNIVHSSIIRVLGALYSLGLFSREGLQQVRAYWNGIYLQDPVFGDPPETDPKRNIHWHQLREWNLEMLNRWEAARGRAFGPAEEESIRLIADELLFPLYPFDLSPSGDVRDLPPPEWPDAF